MFLAAPSTVSVELHDDELCLALSSETLEPLLLYGAVRYNNIMSTSVNLQFAKSERRTYGQWPGHENAQ